MGYVFSKLFGLWTPADYDVPDTSTGLTPRDKDIVRRIWGMLRSDLKNNGVKLFLKLFDEFPEYQLLFRAFAEVPRDELPNNKKLLAHATSVMYALSSLIDNLEDMECLLELLTKIGVSHKRWNLTEVHFQNLKKVVVVCLEEILGPSIMDTRAKEAWTKTLDVANSVIIKAL